ncbi:MAG: tetratricopeptide repeat protein [Bacteroidales bacterium]|nr:tetratricopeptide repeat protein [Bacteroidales bacterium]
MSDTTKFYPGKNKIKLFGSMALIFVFTLLVYLPILNNDFLKTWDDNRYILDNPHIKDFEPDKIPGLFTLYYDGHYHPLTMISLAIDYSIGGANPKVFHLTSLLFHILNSLLVFWFVILLLRPKTLLAPAITALLFGIATINVESVAWASERKNVLFAFFFLISMIIYIKYINTGKKPFYWLTLFVFILSLFSKVTAITFFAVLFLIDFFYKRKFLSKKIILEKIPFLALTITFGLLAMFAQKSSWGENLSQQYFPFYERLVFSSYSFFAYIFKLIIPVNMSGLYPYPVQPGSFISIAGLAGLLLVFVMAYLFVKKIKDKVLAFGALFFVVNIFLLLKLFEFPAGDYIMADRYAYIPSIGLYLLAAFILEKFMQKKPLYKKAGIAFFIIYTLFISLQTFNRVSVFKNGLVFYSDIIEKSPGAKVAYTNRGGIYRDRGKLNEALADFNKAIKIGPGSYKDFSNRGVVYVDLGKYKKAFTDLNKALEINPGNPDIRATYAYSCLQTGNFQQAIENYSLVLKAKPENHEAYANRGTAFYNQGNLQAAISDYTMAIQLNTGYLNAWFNRGLAKIQSGDLSGAIADLAQCVKLKPDHAEAYSNLGVVYSKTGNFKEAFANYNKALSINPSYAEAYLNRGIDYYYLGQFDKALKDFDEVIVINPALGAAYYFRGMVNLKNNNNPCNDFSTALQLGFQMAAEMINTYCK